MFPITVQLVDIDPVLSIRAQYSLSTTAAGQHIPCAGERNLLEFSWYVVELMCQAISAIFLAAQVSTPTAQCI